MALWQISSLTNTNNIKKLDQELLSQKTTTTFSFSSSNTFDFLPNDLGITFHQEAVIHHHCFERSFLENLNSSLFSQKSTDQLTAIEPSYLRVSAAEMSLLEKENSLKKNPS